MHNTSFKHLLEVRNFFFRESTGLGFVVRLRPIVRMWDLGLWGKWGVFLQDINPYFLEFSEKTMKNSKWLGQKMRSEIEPGTFIY